MSAVLTQCPKCRAELVGDVESVRWCQRCNWNVDPGHEVPVISTRGQRAQVQREQELFERLLTSPPKRPSPQRHVWGVLLLMLPFLLFHLTLLAGGVAVVLFGAGSWMWRLGFGSIVFALGLLPWLLTIRRRDRCPRLSRTEHPQLFEAVDAVAAAMGVRPPGGIAIEDSFDISVSVGVRRWVLHIGVPMWMSMTGEQRAAVVANRVAASRHFHSWGGLVMRSADMFEDAYNVGGRLDRWLRYPEQVKPMAVLRLPLMAYMAAKDRLTRESGLRLSYWCDRRAAEATSPSAMAGALVRLHSAIGRASGRLSVWGSRDEAGLWPLLRSLSEPPSSTELTRWERAARLRTTFDPRGQHPPIGHRIAVLEASPLPAQQVSLLSIGADHELVEPVAQLARLMVRGG